MTRPSSVLIVIGLRPILAPDDANHAAGEWETVVSEGHGGTSCL